MPKQQKSKMQELYDPFEDDDLNQYQEEVEQRWGNTEANLHYRGIQFFYNCPLEMYREVGKMYVNDPRFGVYYDRHRPGLTVFMRDAIAYFCDIRKSRA